MDADAWGINAGPAIVEPDIATLGPSQLLKPAPEFSHTRLRDWIAFGISHQYTDPAHPLALLRARRERPRGRTAECSQQFPPSDGDCHTPLPCEVRKGTIARRESAVPNRAAPGAVGALIHSRPVPV